MLAHAHHPETDRKRDLPAGFDIPGLATLVDPQAMCAVINNCLPASVVRFDRCEVVNLRYKTATSCLVTYRLISMPEGELEPAETYVYARGFDRHEFTAAAPQLETTRWVDSEFGPAVTPLPELAVILYWFPNDERLHGLRRMVVGKKLQRVLYDHLAEYPSDEWRISDRSIRRQVLRYKPERRIVMRCRFRAHRHSDNEKHERFVYMSLYEGDRHRYLARILTELRALRSESDRWTVPSPMAVVDEYGLLVTEELVGPSLRALLSESSPDSWADALPLVTARLGELHRVQMPWLPCPSPDDVIRDIRDTRDRLAQFLPEWSGRIGDLAATLTKRFKNSPYTHDGFVHGDLHPGQIILGPEQIGFLDFDRAHRGDPIEDIGNFCAQLWVNYADERATNLVSQWLEAYRESNGHPVNDDSLVFWTSYALFQSALRPIGRIETGWRTRVDEILVEAGRRLA